MLPTGNACKYYHGSGQKCGKGIDLYQLVGGENCPRRDWVGCLPCASWTRKYGRGQTVHCPHYQEAK